MIQISDLLIITMSVVYGLILAMGYTVYQNNPHRPAHQYFYALSAIFVTWLLCNSLQLVTVEQTSIMFLFADYIIGPWVALCLFLFLSHVPHYKNIFSGVLYYSLFIPPILSSLAVINGLVIGDVVYDGNIPVSQPQIFYDSYAYILLGFVISGFIVLISHIFKASGSERKQLRYVLGSAGIVFGLLFIINLLFSSYITGLMQIVLNNLSLIWIAIIGLGIKQYLFNINFFSRTLIQGFIITALAVLLLSIYTQIVDYSTTDFSHNLPIRVAFVIVLLPIFMYLYSRSLHIIENFVNAKKSTVHLLNEDLQIIHRLKPNSPEELLSVVDQRIFNLFGSYPTWSFNYGDSWKTYAHHVTNTNLSDSQLVELTNITGGQAELFISSNLRLESIPGGKKGRLVELMDQNEISIMYPISTPESESPSQTFAMLFLGNESPFVGRQELSYISMIMPQINTQLYTLYMRDKQANANQS